MPTTWHLVPVSEVRRGAWLEDDYAYKNQWLQVETRGSCGDTYAMPIHTKEHGCIGWLYRIREDKGVALTFVPMPDSPR